MKTASVVGVCVAVALSCWLASCRPGNLMAAESSGAAAIGKDLEKDVGMPMLDGDLWQKMTHDDKVAFIWGFWHVVEIEGYLMGKYPDLKKENFSAKVIEASDKKPLTIGEIVAMVDKFYQANPDEIEKPVVGVLWDETIKPNIRTGINGRPLKP
jgi:hypothetical protein